LSFILLFRRFQVLNIFMFVILQMFISFNQYSDLIAVFYFDF